jgi:hypothetical protein
MTGKGAEMFAAAKISHRFAAALVLSALGTTVPAQAQGLVDIGRIILGLPTEQKEPIDYRERAPLVVPPSQNLRPPLEATPAEQRRANWPQDPDVAARRQAAENARRPISTEAVEGRDPVLTRRMTPAEIRAGRVAGAEVPRSPTPALTLGRNSNESDQNVFGGLAALREMDRRDAVNRRPDGELARGEPRREFLTDPPAGVRRPSDNAAFRAKAGSESGKIPSRMTPSAKVPTRADLPVTLTKAPLSAAM